MENYLRLIWLLFSIYVGFRAGPIAEWSVRKLRMRLWALRHEHLMRRYWVHHPDLHMRKCQYCRFWRKYGFLRLRLGSGALRDFKVSIVGRPK